MRKRQDFYPGQLCLFDRYNFTNMKSANTITMVSIIRPYKKRLFNSFSQWMCFVPGTQEVIIVPEEFLCPAPTVEEMENIASIIMVRNPVNLPEFTESDVSNIRMALGVLEEHKSFYNKDSTSAIDNINNIITGLNKILLKFKFYSRMITKPQPMMMNLGRISSVPFEDKNNTEEDEYDEDDI